MENDKLILLKQINPIEYEIHRGEIRQTKNLIFTTTDYNFADKVVDAYNSYGNKESLKNKKPIEEQPELIGYLNTVIGFNGFKKCNVGTEVFSTNLK